jgi:hypothetical protein
LPLAANLNTLGCYCFAFFAFPLGLLAGWLAGCWLRVRSNALGARL